MTIKKYLISFVAILALVASTASLVTPAPARAAAPITITDCAGLQDIDNDLAGDYILGNDIDCSGVADWTPLGTFTGKLDGDGYAIQHLTILDFVNGNAFFGNLNGAKIYNLSFTDATVETNFVGGVLATTATNNTKIVNVHIQGDIFSGALLSLTGGIVGILDGSQIYYSSVNMSVRGYEAVGGLVGVNTNNSVISYSSSQGSVSSYDFNADVNVGGLVGENYNANIYNSYSYSPVLIDTSDDVAGGLVGLNHGTGYIFHTYSTGNIEHAGDPVTNTYVGGLVGKQADSATTEGSYWNAETTHQPTSAAGIGITNAEMNAIDTYTDWDFDRIWDGPGYPTIIPYDDTPAVLTEIEQVPNKAKRAQIKYIFDVAGNFEQEYQVTSCGGVSQAEVGQNDDGYEEVHLQQTEIGETYTCEVYTRNLTDQESNHLTIGPFKVISPSLVSGSLPNPVNPIPFQQTTPLNTEQQINMPTMGVNSLLTRNLYFGLRGSDVKLLQQFLNSHGFQLASSGPGSPGQETETFGSLTRDAVIRYQKANGIRPSAGYVGLITRAAIAK